ncbi:LysR family transcriptional regulator ArgP [Acinetobacter sp. B5B]|uniref:LysR family transcriptional regulator ArgP n=1 Tax=Acinetobacter baretiae TaxID=2605383 RepID=UPI0018C22CBB|nr:LysR family transcriptional regulator ArgP [Acinetobacter baretiae]MBF7681925.1 LysR family transcriptional regulator ArgP [Acinetobacter baretiae]MBF7685703.1 LysR family transcriptional regulator ArgP [Acinetobacter baretiae]
MLDHKQCQAFLAVIETGSFEHAATQLNVTASAITLRVKALERSLGHILLIRERPCYPTQAGQDLLQYLNKIMLLEQDLFHQFTGKHPENSFYQAHIAINADSLATWFLPALKDMLLKEKIILKIHLDDQDHTHHLLSSGQVNACISSNAITQKGCHAIYLGKIGYHMVACPSFIQQWFPHGLTRQALRTAPAVIFNRKDEMHINSLLHHFGLSKTVYPYHLIPSSESFLQAIEMGFGYGMLPDLQIQGTDLVVLSPALSTEIELYWHHWQQQSDQMKKLTLHIQQQAQIRLQQDEGNTRYDTSNNPVDEIDAE